MKVIEKDGMVVDRSFSEVNARDAFRHTSTHILAQAVKRLYPNTKCAIGPSIENGFYYDFEFSFPFSEDNLVEVENEMKRIVKESLPMQRFVLSKNEATKFMSERNESYKVELINELPEGEVISFFKQGEFVDLCAGPHVSNTCIIKAIKLLSIAGAYWRGNERNIMLTRIYGTSFPNSSELNAHLKMLEEAKLRDHRKLGKELGLFTILDEGPGFPFFLPKGQVLKNILINYWRNVHQREGYAEISTPMMLEKSLWETSGHWEHYRESMYTSKIDDNEFAIKPMNCPGAMLVYKTSPHSYKELPIKMSELGLVHRHEKSGQLHGLMRVRCFTQDDAHIFMTEEQVIDEIKNVVMLINEVYSVFGFRHHVELSTRPENSIGSDEDWVLATNALENAIKSMDLPYVVNPGDGAFYGPKLDFHLQDSIGRTWQCGTIQLDFQLPLRFETEYIGSDGLKHRPIMIHHVVLGSIERFIGILIEHYAGKFPLWLSPVQVKVLPVSDRYLQYAETVVKQLKAEGLRCEIDKREEKLGYKIREAQLDRVPYMLIVGQKEQDEGCVSVRKRDVGDVGVLKLSDFISNISSEL